MADESIDELRKGLTEIEKLAFPALQRPPIPYGAAPTNELVRWAVLTYCFSLLSHFREMLRSFLFLVENGHIPASFVVARCLFEMAAHSYYVHKHIAQYLDANNLQAAWDFLYEVNTGSRYMQEEYGDETERPPFAAPREIGKVMNCFNEWEGCKGRAKTEYSFLSEFAHPNMAAFAHYRDMSAGIEGFGKATFQEPERAPDSAPAPVVSIACVSALHFVQMLLTKIGEDTISPSIRSALSAMYGDRH